MLGYRDTGTLFFRDRSLLFYQNISVIHSALRAEAPYLFTADNNTLQIQFNHYNSRDASVVSGMTRTPTRPAHGLLYLKALTDTDYPDMCHFQDSSVVLVDKTRHTAFLSALSRMLPTFNVGWGDKEIYWISALSAGAPFAFSPYLASTYGPRLMHYDPNGVTKALSDVNPMYMNAEGIIEHASAVGVGIEPSVVKPTAVHWDMKIPALLHDRDPYDIYGNSSRYITTLNRLLLRVQWERVGRRQIKTHLTTGLLPAPIIPPLVSNSTYGVPEEWSRYMCIPIVSSFMMSIYDMADNLIKAKGLCRLLGCPMKRRLFQSMYSKPSTLPSTITTTTSNTTSPTGTYAGNGSGTEDDRFYTCLPITLKFH